MNYEYAAKKIEDIFNHELEHIDRIRGLVEPNPDWSDRTSWIMLMTGAVDQFTAAARTVIEIYIELSMGECENWRELHKLEWECAERLKIEVQKNKEELDKI